MAIGGQFGAATIYVSEMAPVGIRGLYTAILQGTALLGLLLALALVMVLQAFISPCERGPRIGGAQPPLEWRRWLPGSSCTRSPASDVTTRPFPPAPFLLQTTCKCGAGASPFCFPLAQRRFPFG